MARGFKERLLIAGGAVLVLLTVLLLVSLREPVEPAEVETEAEPAAKPEEVKAATPAPPSLRPTAPAISTSPAPTKPPVSRPVPVAAAPDQGGPVISPRAAASEVIKVRQIPHAGHVTAPAAEPPGIENEPDPQRREVLRRMHKLAVAKMRQGVFSRRAQMLEQSLAEARASGTWPKDKITRAAQDLKQLEENIKASNAEVDELKKKVDEELPPK